MVPSDRSKGEWEEHYKTMTWPSIPYGDARIQKLIKEFGVTGIPQLLILETHTGFNVTSTGRQDI